jgi:ActR/RegA family two-component response regulator
MDKIKLLVVDDQEHFSLPFKGWLFSTREFDVETIEYGGDTLSKMEEFKPDIVVLDLDLRKDAAIGDHKRSDGEVVANMLRAQHPEFDRVPFLILTQWKDVAEAEALTARDEGRGIFWMAKGDLELRRLAFIANIFFRWR